MGRFRGEALGCENPKDNKNQHEHDLLPRNGGSDCVGARALSAGTFMNCWAIKTKTLRYRMPTACEGKNLWNGNRNPVTLVSTVVARKSAVQPLLRFAVRNPAKTTNPDRIPTKLNAT